MFIVLQGVSIFNNHLCNKDVISVSLNFANHFLFHVIFSVRTNLESAHRIVDVVLAQASCATGGEKLKINPGTPV